jgi:hypothetical protein
MIDFRTLGQSKLDFSFPSGPYLKLHMGGQSIVHYGVWNNSTHYSMK